MGFKLGKASLEKLSSCETPLIEVVNAAIEISQVDFSVVEGIRTAQKQRLNIENGVSWTMKSKHLANANGLSEAADIYPWVNGATSHDKEHYKLVAKAMYLSAMRLGVVVSWGGLWAEKYEDMPHWELL